MATLSDDDVSAGLSGLTDWRRDGDEIVRDVECPSFSEAISFVTRIADLAEAANHHPDIDIRYHKLRIALTSHDAGGLTQRDLDLAAQIDATAPASG
ncbi:MAG: 4a-hydroxytetrahydrobiopterin dehydratase [Actinobacteria bacterium]|nr:4a-hydroxytetrahydrobiopterin dehydratase [Actinomycetota bacterium]